MTHDPTDGAIRAGEPPCRLPAGSVEEVSIALSPEDLVALRDYLVTHTSDGHTKPKTRASIWVFIAFMGGLFAPLSYWKRPPESYLELAILLAGPLAAVAAMVILLRLKPFGALLRLLIWLPLAKARLRNPENAIQCLRIQIGPDSITVSGEGASEKIQAIWTNTHRWEDIKRIAVKGRYAYFIADSNRTYVVPERAFRDEESFRGFVDKARGFYKAAT